MRAVKHLVLALAVLALCGCGKKAPTGPIQLTYSAGDGFWVVIVDEKMIKGPDDYVELARTVCKEEDVCHTGFWFNQKDAPNLLPISPAQVRAEAFVYGKNEGKEIMWWNCRRYPSQISKDCIPVPLNQ